MIPSVGQNWLHYWLMWGVIVSLVAIAWRLRKYESAVMLAITIAAFFAILTQVVLFDTGYRVGQLEYAANIRPYGSLPAPVPDGEDK